MVIDFNNIPEEQKFNFKGGVGELDSRDYIDGNNKIMFSRLKPGASSGHHSHDGSSEIAYILSGEAVFKYDDTEEVVKAGQVHYCPEGHNHSMHNRTTEDIVYLAIVPQHPK